MPHRPPWLALGVGPLVALAAAPAFAADTPAHPTQGPPPAAFLQLIAAHPELRGHPREAAARCKVSAAGAVSDCVLVREYPTNTPLGPALLDAASQFTLVPATHDGRAVDSTVLLDVGKLRADKPAGWLHKPTPQDLLAVWPRQALRDGVSGQAMLDCLVNTDGVLFECLVQSETPFGMHFGDAALALTPQLLMKPAQLDGRPVVSVARIPISFQSFGRTDVAPVGRRTASPGMVWAQAPSYAQVAADYPEKARKAKLGGRATLYCTFTHDGGLHDCEVLAEEPRGDGFAAAARKLAQDFRAYPAADGKGFDNAAVQLPVTFDPAMLDGATQVLGKAQWAALPSAADVHAAFVALPKHEGTMHAVLECVVQEGGWMGDCAVKSETPAGKGMGAAALALSAKVRVITWTDEGLPVVGGRIDVPIRYESGAPLPAPAATPPSTK